MLTDAPPRKANRAGFLESDQTRTLDLPQDGSLLTITKSIESAMRRVAVLQSSCLRLPRACSQTVASARTMDDRTFRGLHSRNHADPGLDALGGAQGGHVIRHVREHSLPRVLPSSRFSEVRIPRLMAHSRLLRASGCALPSCERNAAEEALLDTNDWRAVAHRLAADESGRVIILSFLASSI